MLLVLFSVGLFQTKELNDNTWKSDFQKHLVGGKHSCPEEKNRN